MEFLIVLILVAAVVVYVTGPLRRAAAEGPAAGDTDTHATEQAATVAELEAAREAKYREIRDAELDHQTGKLSDADYGELDASLRAEAVSILGALDKAQATAGSQRG